MRCLKSASSHKSLGGVLNFDLMAFAPCFAKNKQTPTNLNLAMFNAEKMFVCIECDFDFTLTYLHMKAHAVLK